MKVVIPLAKNALAPLGITAAASAINTGIQKKKIHGSGTTTLIISNEEINDIMKILLKVILLKITFYWKESLKQLKTKQKNKKEDF